ncbi:16S rRNA (uracil(1498)-N(3))-methyltransferase [Frankia sp. Cppng1_Ct_nod]|uniref:16S rRNA (uracil(1498)-N(3))-methyltransferase n=1 Tax=Frankia sp. Cppng1_Ct_nod TaxID=2897162 RepID=UPI0020257BD9|nr:16S rRNA (uracil(1498)-N(3))-methyltransferase [Frankia sp. Cppng1_Ct_nod]
MRELTLSGPEGRHAATVRRLHPGERLDITDGCGVVAECTVLRCRRDEVDCAVDRRVVHPAPAPRLVVVQALAKGDRGELAVELMTEVGVDEIIPWAASRSIVRWDADRGARAHGRWVTTAHEAAKQSRRVFWPRIGGLADTDAVAARLAGADLAAVLHEAATEPLVAGALISGALISGALVSGALDAQPVAATSGSPEIVVVVGPEGGLTEGELEVFAASGARPFRLGGTVLRTSTAGVVAAAVVFSHTSRWDR